MPVDGRDRLAELGDFLAALRAGGVPVGPGEIERLRHLFGCEPRLDRAGLKTLLGALLIKNPAQRQVFEGLFAAWCPDHAADWPQPAIAPPAPQSIAAAAADAGDRKPFAAPPPPETPPPSEWLLRAFAGLLVVALVIWAIWPPPPLPIKTPAIPPTVPQAVPSPGPSQDPDLPDQPVSGVWTWQVDEITPAAVRVPKRLGPLPLAALGALALALAVASWWRYRRRFPRLAPRPQAYRGFGWQVLPKPLRDDGALVDARARRQLVWNIERFVADDPTRRLNLPRTVERTARAGGFARFCFQPAVFDRAIWFWLDRHLERPTPREIAAQLGATLRAAGLDARHGFFTDAPQRVDWPGQPAYRPLAEEGQGRQAQVAIFSDGAGLRRELAHPLSRDATLRLLRALQQWPKLCFVDCSADGEQLAALLAEERLRLEVVALPALADWLGGAASREALAATVPEGLFGAARQWAAVVALAGEQADAASAQTLRALLDLPASAWEVDRIVAASAQPEDRRRLINWLLRSEPRDGEKLHPESLARRALDWWQARYRVADEEKCAQENPLLPWRGSLASRRWQLEHALLQLYTDAVAAADRLSELAGDPLRSEIQTRLGEFAAADHRPLDRDDDAERIHLTWRFAALPVPTRQRLRALGFAGNLYPRAPPPLRPAPRLVLATTLLSTLAFAAFSVATARWWVGNAPRLLVQDPLHEHPTLAAQTLRVVERSGPQAYRVTLGNARASVTLDDVPEAAEIAANWRWTEQANPLRLQAGGSVLLRAGSLAQPIRACAKGWPQRSLAVVVAPDADAPARQLAIRLLDRGSADQVLVAPDAAALTKDFSEWLGASTDLQRNTQVLIIVPERDDAAATAALLKPHPGAWAVVAASDLAALARAVNFPGAKPVGKSELPWRVVASNGETLVYGGAAVTTANGIDWVSICPGTFTMGSRKGEAMARDDEIVEPARVVALSPFEIAASETTNAQYAQLVPEHSERDDRPVSGVNWEKARSFCQRVGGDLPSEAQWEYAARGGSQTSWSFGDDAKQLGRYAWFAENSGYAARPVKQKAPNPLGLYDMHGNVWEWTRDWYGRYASGSFVDPEAAKDSRRRVLRGGSFAISPEDLRSAGRVGGDPEDRFRYDGFRCVRVPPQP